MDVTNNDRITILTSEQIQMVLDNWYDRLDSSDEFTNLIQIELDNINK